MKDKFGYIGQKDRVINKEWNLQIITEDKWTKLYEWRYYEMWNIADNYGKNVEARMWRALTPK